MSVRRGMGRFGAVAALTLAAACSGDDGDSRSEGDAPPSGAASSSSGAGPAGPPSSVCRAGAELRLAVPVADARARAPFTVGVDVVDRGGMRGPHPIEVSLVRDGAAPLVLHTGAHDLGAFDVTIEPARTASLALGPATIVAKIGCPPGATEAAPGEASAPLWLVRLGVTSVDVQAGDGERLPLLYHAVDRRYQNLFPVGAVTAATLAIPDSEPEIDAPDGALRAFEKPWDDVASPPVDATGAVLERGVTYPVSLRVGTRPDVVLTVGKTARGDSGPSPVGLDAPGLPEIRVALAGAPAGSGAPITAGGEARVRMPSSPVPAVARVDHPVAWRFEAKDASGAWREIPGAGSSVTVRLYGVLGNTQGTTAPNLPWVAVVDDATRAVNGAAADAAGVRSALVRHVYQELGLSYDRAQGASHYTSYAGTYAAAGFKLARFLGRDFGPIVNCSDCASILSTYANMIGADLSYTIITSSFSLHPILGIGASAFGSPFDSGRMAFTYHAVTSPDAAATIWDATLAVDGDADPATAPYVKKLVQGMAGAEYLDRLSGDVRAKYNYVDKKTTLSF